MTHPPDEDLAKRDAKPLSEAGWQRLYVIDALRGAACLAVMLHHLRLASWSNGLFQGHDLPTRAAHWFALRGFLGVHLFLVLSGFCLFYPLVRRHGSNVRNVVLPLRSFFVRRGWRILPPYYAALTLATLLPLVPVVGHVFGQTPTVASVLTHVFLVNNLHSATIGTINPSFWSLALEAQLYLIFPLLLWLGRRGGLRLLLGMTLLVSVAWQYLAYRLVGLDPPQWEVGGALFHALPARCFEFAAGMAAAFVVARPPKPGEMRWALGLGVVCAVIGLRAALVSRFGPHGEPAWGVAFACLLVVSCRRAPNEWFTGRAPLAVLSGLGGISYSVYLLHQWLIGVMYWFVPVLPPGGSGASFLMRAVLGLAVVGALVGAGFVLFVLVEAPALRRRTKTPATVVAPGTVKELLPTP